MPAWTPTQAARLKELEADPSDLQQTFLDAARRNQAFQHFEKRLVKEACGRLREFRDHLRRPAWCRLETRLVNRLVGDGFVQVAPPPSWPGGTCSAWGSMPIIPWPPRYSGLRKASACGPCWRPTCISS